MLNLRNVSLRRGRKLLFTDASLQLHAGQRLGLVGANGCGKTSLFSMLLGELEADHGEVVLDRRLRIAHVAQESPSGQCAAIDFVQDGDQELREAQETLASAQDSGDQQAAHRAFDLLETIDGFSAEARAARLLHGLGFAPEDSKRPVEEFSGGCLLYTSDAADDASSV